MQEIREATFENISISETQRKGKYIPFFYILFKYYF